MRYHYEKKNFCNCMHGRIYICKHPLYHKCTLYKVNNLGLAVIQQRFNPTTKSTWWGEVDSWLVDDIYDNPYFTEYFNKRASNCTDELYPTVTVRQIMWALKMKPLPKERWETVFDRKNI